MLSDGGQLIGVLLILAGAVGYLSIYYRRVIKGDRGGCGCGCGVPFKRESSQEQQEPPPAPTGKQQFLPAENLADLAARHRQDLDRDSAGRAEPPPSS